MKRLKTVLLLLMLSFCIQITAAPGTVNAAGATVKKTGLVKQKGKYFYYQKGKKLKSQWKTVTVKGKKYRYYFGKDGAAYAGKVKYGEKVPAVKKIGKATYAFDCNGRMLKGIQVINQKFYVFSASSGKLDTKKDHSTPQSICECGRCSQVEEAAEKIRGEAKKDRVLRIWMLW